MNINKVKEAEKVLQSNGYSIRKKKIILTNAQRAILDVLSASQRLTPLRISIKTRRQIREKTFALLANKGLIKSNTKSFDIQKSSFRLTAKGKQAIAA